MNKILKNSLFLSLIIVSASSACSTAKQLLVGAGLFGLGYVCAEKIICDMKRSALKKELCGILDRHDYEALGEFFKKNSNNADNRALSIDTRIDATKKTVLQYALSVDCPANIIQFLLDRKAHIDKGDYLLTSNSNILALLKKEENKRNQEISVLLGLTLTAIAAPFLIVGWFALLLTHK